MLSDLTGSIGGRSRGKGERDTALARVMFPRAGKPLLIDPFNPYSMVKDRRVEYTKPIPATILWTIQGKKRKKKKKKRKKEREIDRLALQKILAIPFSHVRLGFHSLSVCNPHLLQLFFIIFFQTEFWGCVNSTLNGKRIFGSTPFEAKLLIINPSWHSPIEVKRHENWTGRRCCYLVQNPICRSTCALSGSRRNLNESCRPSDEPEFFSCLERREEAEHCCGKVSNDTCRTVCQNLFYKREKISSRNGCFHQMPKCLKSVTEVKHAENPKQRA